MAPEPTARDGKQPENDHGHGDEQEEDAEVADDFREVLREPDKPGHADGPTFDHAFDEIDTKHGGGCHGEGDGGGEEGAGEVEHSGWLFPGKVDQGECGLYGHAL